jgi:hypothetical protein
MKKLSQEQINSLKKEFKGSQLMEHGLRYLTDKKFFVNKQFDNKKFCIVATSGLSESVLGLFRVKSEAIKFGEKLGLEQISPPPKLAYLRDDLIDSGLSVPVGNTFYGDKTPLHYKIDREGFRVKLNNKWQEAESIDWNY